MTSAHGPLHGVRVVALEQAVAGPLASRHLADLGAQVVKIERPDRGDLARGYDRFVEGYSSHFVWLNRHKRSLALDIKSEQGLRIFEELLRGADVLVANLGPGALDRVISDDDMHALNPALIRCVISGYGSEGPYRDRKAYDALIQGEAGVTRNTGEPGRPAKPAVSVADVAGAVYGAMAVCAALHERERTGVGRRVDVSLFDGVVEWMTPLLLAARHLGSVPEPAGLGHATIVPYGAYPVAGGELINLAVQTNEQWRRLCAVVLQRPELGTDERFADNPARLRNRAEVDQLVGGVLTVLELAEAQRRLDEADVPWGMLNTCADVLAHPQLAERWLEVSLPNGRRSQMLRPPFVFSPDTRPAEPGRIPELGQDTDEILAELGHSGESIETLRREGHVA